MRTTTRIGVVLAAIATALSLMSNSAQATTDSTIETMVDDMVVANPGARQISANAVRLANGVEASAVSASACPYYYLCIYDGTFRSGYQWNFYYCGFVNIGNFGWSDRINSYVNNQTIG
jgi:hypothetical protein